MDIGGLQDAAKARRERLMAARAKVFYRNFANKKNSSSKDQLSFLAKR